MFWLTTVPSKFVVKIAPDNWAYEGAARTSAPIATRTHDRRCLCILFLLDFKMMMPTQPAVEWRNSRSKWCQSRWNASPLFSDDSRQVLVLGRPNHASPCVFVVIS